MRVKCLHEKCVKKNGGVPYEWEYKGKQNFYCTCPKCLSKIKLEDNKQNE
jgi:hypothetical protein